MATLREIIATLDTFIESTRGLGISCIRGYPNFKNPQINPPLAAIFYTGSSSTNENVSQRMGQSTGAIVVTLGIYATDEINLFELAEQLQLLRSQRIILTVGSGADQQRPRVRFGDDEREPPDPDDIKELRHFITCPIVLS